MIKKQICEHLEAYFYGRITDAECLHKIQMLVEYHTPSDWSYEDYKQGREQNKPL